MGIVRGTGLLIAVLCAGCGRFGFESVPSETDSGVDADPDASAGEEVVVDFGSAYTYKRIDFIDSDNGGFDEEIDNVPQFLCLPAPPFGSSIVMVAGRALFVATAHSSIIGFHDYTPTARNSTGPDGFGDCMMKDNALFLGAASFDSGDGVFSIDSTFAITRHNAQNNVEGMFIDDGTHTGGVPDLVFESDSELRTLTNLITSIAPARRYQVQRTSAGGLVGVEQNQNDLSKLDILTVDPTTLVGTKLFESRNIYMIKDAKPASPALVTAIIDGTKLVHVFADAHTELIATVPAGRQWIAGAVPPAGSTLASGMYLLEADTYNTDAALGPIVAPTNVTVVRLAN